MIRDTITHSIELFRFKRLATSYVCEDKNNCNIYTLPVGVQNMMTTLVIYYKINYLATLYPNNFTPTYLCKKKNHHHSSFIHSGQNLETTYQRRIGNILWYISTMDYYSIMKRNYKKICNIGESQINDE